jgi:hypothetical protein
MIHVMDINKAAIDTIPGQFENVTIKNRIGENGFRIMFP